MIIWRGKVIAVALITFGCLVLSDLASRLISGDDKYYETHGWPKLIGFWVAAGFVFALRSWFEPAVTGAEIQTGKEVSPPPQNELFFVSVRFWPPILLALGVVFFFVRD